MNKVPQYLMYLSLCMVVIIAAAIVPVYSQGGGNPLNNKCDCAIDKTYNVDVCIAGVTYNVDLKFCESNYVAPFPAGNCSPLGQNRKSVLKEVCFTAAFPVGSTHRDILGAILCHIRDTGCMLPSPYGFVVPNNGLYCWEVAMPKCTKRVANCIRFFDECKFCTYAFAWDRINGICAFRVSTFVVCDDGICQGASCDETSTCPEFNCCQ
ncbi:MAG: hypothetical protein RIR53_431 [Bacteroidota bacterium]|jgi:hypothetical protein